MSQIVKSALIGASLLSSETAQSACTPQPEFVQEVVVRGCAVPDNEIDEWLKNFPKWLLSSDSERNNKMIQVYSDRLKGRGAILEAKVVRQCQVSRDPLGRINGKCTWVPTDAAGRYFWYSDNPNICSELPIGSTRRILVDQPCCDTRPANNPSCFLNVKSAWPIQNKDRRILFATDQAP